jgi:3-oxo-5-alpha-steroid 4-dehydrogenase 1
MNETDWYALLLKMWFGLSGVVFLLLLFITAPYGRHARKGWGPSLPSSVGWVLMEAPAAFLFASFFLLAGKPLDAATWIFFSLWELHYIHRAFIYPFLRGGKPRPMPVLIVSFGFFFNLVNVYLNGRYLTAFSPGYPNRWMMDPRFVLGLLMFLVGFVINRHSDAVLARLRAHGVGGYQVPAGGFYRFVSSPNYLGEMFEWFGFAIATWSAAGLAFAVWTAANLIPRAISHHRWYRRSFPEYPAERKAIIPFLW